MYDEETILLTPPVRGQYVGPDHRTRNPGGCSVIKNRAALPWYLMPPLIIWKSSTLQSERRPNLICVDLPWPVSPTNSVQPIISGNPPISLENHPGLHPGFKKSLPFTANGTTPTPISQFKLFDSDSCTGLNLTWLDCWNRFRLNRVRCPNRPVHFQVVEENQTQCLHLRSL